MATALLIRHGRTAANTSGELAGQVGDVGLDDVGREQADALAARLAGVPLTALVCGPLRRCRETAQTIANPEGFSVDERLTECDYGRWTGRSLKELARDRLWRVVQTHPSAVVFPGGESLRAVQTRAVDAIREHDAQAAARAGPGAVWAAVSHGDVIKTIVADALGLHLDLFQRITVAPGSVTIVEYTALRPFLVRLNDVGGDLSGLRSRRRGRRPSNAMLGGGPGTP
ncbi:MAG: MSMEG_4193 family putative phosphomutase [Jiangellaceae bacterium]|nr:MSMEG_4193 family putative phosphomutase [Jiangellaceae bacterium]